MQLDFSDAEFVTRHHVCGHCGGRLIATPTPVSGVLEVICTTPECKSTVGFINREFYERKKAEDAAQAAEAKANLAAAMPELNPVRSINEALRLLGF